MSGTLRMLESALCGLKCEAGSLWEALSSRGGPIQSMDQLERLSAKDKDAVGLSDLLRMLVAEERGLEQSRGDA